MLYYIGAIVAVLFLTILAVLYYKFVYGYSHLGERREVKAEEAPNEVLSVRERIIQDIYNESLDLSIRQCELNKKMSKGDFSEKTQIEQIKIELDRERLVERSLNAGLGKDR